MKEKRTLTFVQTDQLHLTLKFVGSDVSQESIDSIIANLTRRQGELLKPKVKLDELHFGFKSEIRPTVLFLSTEDNPKLDELAYKINEITRELGQHDIAPNKDRKKFTHHLTIARAKSTVNRNFKRKVTDTLASLPKTPVTFEPEYISVMRSELTNSGPRYTELARISLH